jgi:Uma2 family endonuclease
LKHYNIQRRLRMLLEGFAGEQGVVDTEMAFRALPEYELRVADVAFVSRERWERADGDDNIRGAPELVIEVLSPSNTVSEINDKEKLCLENGSLEFWVVDPGLRQVKVATPSGITTTYGVGQEIPLNLFGGDALKVDDIFQ